MRSETNTLSGSYKDVAPENQPSEIWYWLSGEFIADPYISTEKTSLSAQLGVFCFFRHVFRGRGWPKGRKKG